MMLTAKGEVSDSLTSRVTVSVFLCSFPSFLGSSCFTFSDARTCRAVPGRCDGLVAAPCKKCGPHALPLDGEELILLTCVAGRGS